MKVGDKVYRVQMLFCGELRYWENTVVSITPKYIKFLGGKHFRTSIKKSDFNVRLYRNSSSIEIYTDDLNFAKNVIIKEYIEYYVLFWNEKIQQFNEIKDEFDDKLKFLD